MREAQAFDAGMMDKRAQTIMQLHGETATARAECERLRAEVSAVERQIRLVAYTSAGDPKRMDDTKMFAIWAGELQKALGSCEPAAIRALAVKEQGNG